jgi:hypothetical protein
MKILIPFLFFATLQAAPRNLSKPIPLGNMPTRVHVFEDYETEIEKRWWLRGEPVKANLPQSLSASRPNTRASRATITKDFDRKMGDQTKMYKAVIFKPSPRSADGPQHAPQLPLPPQGHRHPPRTDLQP